MVPLLVLISLLLSTVYSGSVPSKVNVIDLEVKLVFIDNNPYDYEADREGLEAELHDSFQDLIEAVKFFNFSIKSLLLIPMWKPAIYLVGSV